MILLSGEQEEDEFSSRPFCQSFSLGILSEKNHELQRNVKNSKEYSKERESGNGQH